jgi:cytochrome c oxidase subunit I+III
VHFGSLLFGYAFLWTVAPNWPPPSYLAPGLIAPALALAGAAALVAGPRLAAQSVIGGRRPWGIALGALGVAGMGAAAASVILARPDPASHAYDATLWLLAGHVALHVFITTIMLGYVALRIRAGYASPRRIGEVRIVQLWADYTALTGLVALGAAWLPGAFA